MPREQLQPPEERAYTLPEIARASGADYRTLANWLKAGLFKPSIRDGRGSGNAGFYSAADASLVCKLVELRRRGLEIEALETVARFLREQGETECPICRDEGGIRV